eukprot:GHVU01173834.1.p1 GENE.GHVU01173834.1~~GHVU01173834.1.p1  ORF type:complete len:143 (+),score=0.95 GHVU01173834.1:402-830(+)
MSFAACARASITLSSSLEHLSSSLAFSLSAAAFLHIGHLLQFITVSSLLRLFSGPQRSSKSGQLLNHGELFALTFFLRMITFLNTARMLTASVTSFRVQIFSFAAICSWSSVIAASLERQTREWFSCASLSAFFIHTTEKAS